MSIRTRVKRLEDRSGNRFVVGIPGHLDKDGKPIPYTGRDADTDPVKAFCFSAGGQRMTVPREVGEPFKDFSRRAHALAREHLGVTVWPHPAVKGL